jgi:predicted Zn-dependent protease
LLLQLPAQGNASGGPVANARGELLGVLAGKEAPNQQAAYAASTAEVRAFLAEAQNEAIRQSLMRLLNAREWLLRRILFFSGLENIQHERWKVAIESFDAIIEAEPLNRTALLLRAEALRKTKEPKKAIADLQRLLDFNPADVPVRLAYAQAWTDAGDTDRAAKERANAEKLKGKP